MNSRVKDLVIFSFFLAIEFIFCFTPLGSINLFGPVVATLAMIPVSLLAIFKGLKQGLLLGFFMGLFSLIVWTFMPPAPVGFIFSPFVTAAGVQGNFGSLIICFVPRMMIAVVAYYSYHVLSSFSKNRAVKAFVAGFVSSAAHTILVLLGIYLFFRDSYSAVIGVPIWTIFSSIIISNGIPEAIVNAISCSVVYRSIAYLSKK